MDKPSSDVYLLQQPKLVLERRNIKEKGLCETRWVCVPSFYFNLQFETPEIPEDCHTLPPALLSISQLMQK